MVDGGWAGVDAGSVGLLADHIAAPVNSLLENMTHAAAGQAYLEWTRYRDAGELHRQLVVPEQSSDRRTFDASMQCAARIAMVGSMSQAGAERLLDTAVALRDRLPQVAECLRDGHIAPRYVRTVVERTDLLTDRADQQAVDADIAAILRRRGSWSPKRLRDMVDRIVYRVDPCAVRRRREAAVEGRGFWMNRLEDGMAIIEVTTTAEKAILIARRVEALARSVCARDGRRLAARKSDAHFCLAMGVEWACQCGDDDCTAPVVPASQAPAARDVPGTGSHLVVHVICDLETVAGDGETECFLDGYGVISPAHLDDLLAEPGVRVQPVGHEDEPLSPTQPGNPYRPSTALDTVARARSLYCSMPGCEQPAWLCDIDHVQEFSHTDPAAGGQTTLQNTSPKCRFHHNLKTHTAFLDDQTIGRDGRVETVVITPEGHRVSGPAFTGDDLFPALKDIRFTAPEHAPPDAAPQPDPEPTRRRPRLADKHARRQAEREHNRIAHEAEQAAQTNDAEPPF